ncbi:MAG: outer membrane lipoprotein LolB [Curvibacter lanceolatus]|uniref:lipoprotein insertase outer membrane protein LolB n=1 Tax=Curvibacter lanceolatus TaxID=86182 RepID=UPI00037A2B7E|nr:lipoprotein insertase outer membrane protein LolB [Curvibacter lanceolatus]MBV5292837.1 outer membrane lipoprotein LolB [Curvibacter lanceolatus]
MTAEPRRLRRRLVFAGVLSPLGLLGCASGRRASPDDGSPRPAHLWSGRLALKVDGDAPQSWSASFELLGTPEQGSLDLFSPLGSTVAHLEWTPDQALWQARGETRRYTTLAQLAADATGTPVPIAALFHWLQGQQPNLPGWQADLSQLDNGRLTARRDQPQPALELRIVLDR